MKIPSLHTLRHTALLQVLLLGMGLLTAPIQAPAQALGTTFTYQGQLSDAGQPATGLYDLQLCLFDSPSSPLPISCAPDADDVPVENGLFSIDLDFGAVFDGQERFLELRVREGASSGGYTLLAPRQIIRPTPEALRAASASSAPWLGLSGVPADFADGSDADSGGSVTSISSGTGLSGGTITGSGTIAIANGGVATTQLADGGVATVDLANAAVGLAQIDTNQVQARITQSCPSGQYLRVVNGDGSVTCQADSDTATPINISTGTGLNGGPITGSGTISIANGGVGSTQLANGAVGLAQIDTAQVQARISGICAVDAYIRGINPDGSVVCEPLPGDPTLISTVDNSANNVGQQTAIAIGSDGFPVISYYDDTISALKLAHCANAACTGAATITTVDDPANSVGRHTAIAIGSNGLPVISYYDDTIGALKVAHCANVACTGAATITTVDDDSLNPVGQFSDIAIGNDGLPVISYYDAREASLKVAHCANVACTGTAAITTVDDPVNRVGEDTAIAIGNDGLPVISYYDRTAGALKMAKCGNRSCL